MNAALIFETNFGAQLAVDLALDAGASELAAALRQNTKLQSLALRDNGLTGAGLRPLFDVVFVPLPRFSLAHPGFTLPSPGT